MPFIEHPQPPDKPLLYAIFFFLPLKTTNPLNGSQGFSRGAAMGAAKRRKAQRSTSALVCGAHLKASPYHRLPCAVTITRIAPSNGLDPHDALPASLKGVIDGVADALGLSNDRDPRVTWRFAQRRGKPREYAVEILIESIET